MKKFTFRLYDSAQWSRLNVCHIDEYSTIDVHAQDGWSAYSATIKKYRDYHVTLDGSIIEQMDFMQSIGLFF